MTTPTRYLSARDIAALTGRGLTTVRKAIYRGDLVPAVEVGESRPTLGFTKREALRWARAFERQYGDGDGRVRGS